MSEAKSGAGDVTRRDFLKGSASAAALAALTATGNYAFAQGSDKIRVGVIGCGGRGSGAAVDCTKRSAGVEIYALADMFKFQVDGARNNLKGLGDKLNVTDDRVFSGLDAYKQLLATNCNMVILATPPGFRPIHFKAAVEAGKHVFMEKPVATDGPGIRAVLAAGEVAAQKGLGVVAGTQRRHQGSYMDLVKQIHDGAIGKVVGGQCYWNGGGIWFRNREAGMTDLQYQCWNWYHHVWVCGDHICEQHIHNLDVMNWVLGAHPVKCNAVGGRTTRTGADTQIWDHFGCDYEYPDGVHIASYCRHWPDVPGNVSEHVVGTKGTANPGWAIDLFGGTQIKAKGRDGNPYEWEHADLIASIRAGKPLNETKQVAESTLTAIMGRMAAYSGQDLTWDQVLNSQESLLPDLSKPDAPLPIGPVAVPGKYKV